MAAQAAGKSFRARCFYRRLRSRLGAPKAITAKAHKIAASSITSGLREVNMSILEWTITSSAIGANASQKSTALGFEFAAQSTTKVVS